MQLYSYLASVQVDLVPCLFWTIPIWHWYQERCWVWCWLLPSLLQENVKEGDKKCTIEDKMPPAGTCHVLSCLLLGKSSWCDTRIEPPCVTERTNEWVWILVFVISVCSNLSHTRSDKFVQNQRYGLLISASRFWQWLISIRISGTDAVPSSIFMYFRDWRLNHQTVATLQTNSPMWFSPFLDHEKPCVVHMENPIESHRIHIDSHSITMKPPWSHHVRFEASRGTCGTPHLWGKYFTTKDDCLSHSQDTSRSQRVKPENVQRFWPKGDW